MINHRQRYFYNFIFIADKEIMFLVAFVCLSLRLSFCLSVSNITQKAVNELP